MLIIVSDGVSGDDRQDGGQLMSGAIFTATPSLSGSGRKRRQPSPRNQAAGRSADTVHHVREPKHPDDAWEQNRLLLSSLI